MSYLTQKTIKNNVSFSGVALHSGVNVNISIKPAEPNYGIVFKRVDLKNNNLVFPNFMNVSNTSLNTTVQNEFGVKVSTIEHLMAAFYGLSIDNAIVELDSQEVPNLELYNCKDYLDMARVIKACKFFIGNQSVAYPMAEALRVTRILEAEPDDAIEMLLQNVLNFY